MYIHYGTENQQIDSEKIGTPEEKGILEQASEKLLKKKNRKEKRYKHLDKPVSTMSSSLYTYHIITRTVSYA